MCTDLVEIDLEHIWHPCAQMKDYLSLPPVEIVGGKGCYLYAKSGQKLIDAFSSWWCKSFGHGHPRLREALLQQAERLEHCALVHVTHAPIVVLAEKLSALTTTLNKLLFASDGSCVVEMALKLSLHAHHAQGHTQRRRFVALQHAYHGETLGALSVSDVSLYRQVYHPLLFETLCLGPLPYVTGQHDPRWNMSDRSEWDSLFARLDTIADEVAAVIIEPIIQGAGGMRIYNPAFLRQLKAWTLEHGIHLIADEIMTGLGRSGKLLACQHADIEPDMLCLGKGLTAGWLPLGVLLTSQAIYDVFYHDELNKAFLHSHTYAGNPLAVNIAVTVIDMLLEGAWCDRVNILGDKMYQLFSSIAKSTGRLHHVRYLGGMVAADLLCPANRRMGFEIYKQAMARGALLRPLGNTLYWLPPFNIEETELAELADITQAAILAVPA